VTFGVNVVGCILLGYFVTRLQRRHLHAERSHPVMKAAAAVALGLGAGGQILWPPETSTIAPPVDHRNAPDSSAGRVLWSPEAAVGDPTARRQTIIRVGP
jgi:hypothetical protein